MWQRLKRAMRSMFGWMISAAEDPEMILEQNIRDLNDQVPKMNESIAMVKANVTLLEKENQKYRNDVVELTSKVKAAIQATRDDIATTYATQLQTVKGALARNEQQLLGARQAFDKAMQVKQAFMREKDKKTNEAMQALRDARRSKWQSKVADAMCYASSMAAAMPQIKKIVWLMLENRSLDNLLGWLYQGEKLPPNRVFPKGSSQYFEGITASCVNSVDTTKYAPSKGTQGRFQPLRRWAPCSASAITA